MASMQEIVVISGRSGAGKSTASKALEDMGYFVVDNLPSPLLDDLLSLIKRSKQKMDKLAVITDVREIEFLSLMPKKWQEIDEKKYRKKLIFLDASDETLITRYQETKRRHPLDDGCGIRSALLLEHDLLKPIKEIATKEIFTDKLNTHELKNLIKKEMMLKEGYVLPVTLMSFGFKYGIPSELDLCFDVRFLTNPYYKTELRHKSGLDREVYDYVLTSNDAQQFLKKMVEMIAFLHPLYREEGKTSLTIAIGCTGGRHRSTSLVEALKLELSDGKIDQIRVEHRDLDRQV